MDAQSFDRLLAEAARHPTRRSTLRLLAGAMLGAMFSQRGGAPARAQRLDSDQDGLFDDDETNVYGTRPDLSDTDGDGVGDGEEIYNRDNGLGGPSDPLTPDGGAAAPAVACAQLGVACGTDDDCCVGYCGQDLVCACIRDSDRCFPSGDGGCCNGQPCNAEDFCGVCGQIGARCNSDVDCCQGNFPALCCFSGVSLTTVCTDVSNTGGFCPGEAPVPGGCPAGQTDCGGTCVDLSRHAGHCGACFTSCPLGGICQGGVCGGIICMDGRTDCGGACVDLASDVLHCGACYTPCSLEAHCTGGACVTEVEDEPEATGGGGDDIDDVEEKADPCHVDADGGYPDDLCMETGEEAEEDQE